MSSDEDAKSLSTRWETREGKEKTARILDFFASRKTQSLEKELGRHNGKIDFRGFRFPHPASKGRLDFHGADVGLIERSEYKRLSLMSCDFSHADLGDVMWTKCSFDDCLFQETRMVSSSFWDCSIGNCTFSGCDLTDVVLGGRVGLSSGRITDVEFHDGKFVGVVFSFPRIERCLFDCDIVDVNFNGSQFVGCKFLGKLKGVIFRSRYSPIATDRKVVARLAPENRMQDVDFADSGILDLDFQGGVSLDKCVFPAEVLLVRNGSKVFLEAREVVEHGWTSRDKTWVLKVIDEYYVDRVNEGQQHFLLTENTWTGEEGKRFFDLVKHLSETPA